MNKRLLVFASGTKDEGGSGFRVLFESTRTGILNADIVGVVSNHGDGGVKRIAAGLEVDFTHLTQFEADDYQALVRKYNADFVALSGWLKQVCGLDVTRTFNIHPGPLPEFGGKGMYGHHVHEAVMQAYKAGRVSCSAVSMHFVSDEYDRGPVFFRYPVPIRPDDTAETLSQRVNQHEHAFQPLLTDMVMRGIIRCVKARTGGWYVDGSKWFTQKFVPKEWQA